MEHVESGLAEYEFEFKCVHVLVHVHLVLFYPLYKQYQSLLQSTMVRIRVRVLTIRMRIIHLLNSYRKEYQKLVEVNVKTLYAAIYDEEV